MLNFLRVYRFVFLMFLFFEFNEFLRSPWIYKLVLLKATLYPKNLCPFPDNFHETQPPNPQGLMVQAVKLSKPQVASIGKYVGAKFLQNQWIICISLHATTNCLAIWSWYNIVPWLKHGSFLEWIPLDSGEWKMDKRKKGVNLNMNSNQVAGFFAL